MYDQSNYEEYMRNVLGYKGDMFLDRDNNTYQAYNNMNMPFQETQPNINTNMIPDDMIENNIGINENTNINFEEMYPDIYKIIRPMILKICEENTKPLSEETINEMTDKIFSIIETDENSENRTTQRKINNNNNLKNSRNNINNRSINRNENLDRNSNRNNNLLRDLIKILLINELVGGSALPPFRPPFPTVPHRPRPPHQVHPGRPPIRPREIVNHVQY